MYKLEPDFSVRSALLPLTSIFDKNSKELEEAIFISSPDLYDTYFRKKVSNDGIHNKLRKYFLRNKTRTTPFGTMSAIGIKDQASKIKTLRLRPDSTWLFEVKKKIRGEWEIVTNLDVRWNSSVEIIGRVAILNKHCNPNAKNSSIKISYTEATKTIHQLSDHSSLNFDDLLLRFFDSYSKEVNKEVVLKYMLSLIQKGFLLTSIDLVKSNQNFLDLMNALRDQDVNQPLVSMLLELENRIKRFNEINPYLSVSQRIIQYELIEKQMESICSSKRYFQIDTFFYPEIDSNFKSCNLTQLESFINKLTDFGKYMARIKNRKLHDHLLDKYGYCAVPVIQLFSDFDPKKLLSLTSDIPEQKEIQKQIEKYFHFKNYTRQHIDIEELLDEIKLNNFGQGEYPLFPSVELAANVTKSCDSFEFTITPLIGALGRNKINGRFNFKHKTEHVQDGISIVEVLSQPINSIVENVMQSDIDAEYVLEYGKYLDNSSPKESINLDDIYIVVSDRLHFFSPKINKEILFSFNNSANFKLFDDKIQFLLYQSINQYASPFTLLEMIDSISRNMPHTAESRYQNISVTPERWKLNYLLNKEKCTEFHSFVEEMKQCIDNFNFSNVIGLEEDDKRLVLDITKEVDLLILFEEYNKGTDILISNASYVFNESITKNAAAEDLLNEFIFEFKSIDNTPERESPKNLFEITNERFYAPFSSGWTNFHIYYNNKDLAEEILTSIYHESITNSHNFFIRYIDSEGSHIRWRIKDNLTGAFKINEILNNLILSKMIREFKICNYTRELERYGGLKNIDIVEEYFSIESQFVLRIFQDDEVLKEVEKKYLTVLYMYLILDSAKRCLNVDIESLRDNKQRKLFRKDYREMKKLLFYYLKEMNNSGTNSKIVTSLNTFKKNIDYCLLNLVDLSDSQKYRLIQSLCHMFYNRFDGIKPEEEEKMTTITGHLVYEYSRFLLYKNKTGEIFNE